MNCPEPSCGYSSQNEHAVKSHKGKVHGANTEVCDQCGTEFNRAPAKSRQGQHDFCSDECKYSYRTGENNPNGTNSVLITCANCGEESKKPVSVAERGQENVYCNEQCQTEHWREEGIQSGEDNPMYGGKGSDFRQRHEWKDMRVAVLERDKQSCQRCGGDSDLHVHHKIPVFAGGEKLDKANLQTLCSECHRDVHRFIDGLFAKREV